MASGQLQDNFRTTSGQLQDKENFRMTKAALRAHSNSILFVSHELRALSYRQSLKYFVLFKKCHIRHKIFP